MIFGSLPLCKYSIPAHPNTAKNKTTIKKGYNPFNQIYLVTFNVIQDGDTVRITHTPPWTVSWYQSAYEMARFLNTSCSSNNKT
jgi:hypothetical protein